MKIFDFTVNTQDATIDDFNNAIDNLRYMNARSGWNRDGYLGEKAPDDFQKQPLTFDEYETWIKSIYVFIERCVDFYPPTNNFLFPYRKFNMKEGLDRYLKLYIMMEYFRNQDCLLFAYDYFNKNLTRSEKELSSFVNVSQIVRAIIISYNPVVNFNINKYKDFGASFKGSDFFLDCFPLANISFNDNSILKIQFSFFEYIIQNGKLYRMKKTDFPYNMERFDAYLESHPEHKGRYNAIIKDREDKIKSNNELEKSKEQFIANNNELSKENLAYNNQLVELQNKAKKLSVRISKQKTSEVQMEIKRISDLLNEAKEKIGANKKEIERLKSKKVTTEPLPNIIREFILSLPDFLEYKEVQTV